jgi:uncharacterized membrane protein
MSTSTPVRRIESIDLLRGIVIVLMALDHARDFFGPTRFRPEDLDNTSVMLFFTRWVTHFCAPVFVFLAGTGAALWAAKGQLRRDVARFLVSRGIWLIVLELLVVNTSWLQFYYNGFVFVQVIWVLGWSMIVLAALIYLPRTAVVGIGLALCLGHNLLDPIQARSLGQLALLWGLIHQPHWQPLTDGLALLVIYPLVPWVGVMALGYAFGDLFKLAPSVRHRRMLWIGLACVVAFAILRSLNVYGEPNAWAPHERGPVYSFLSFLNTEKYPPSLLFLLMTLGPAILAIPVLEKARGPLSRLFVTFGRVPLFFYLIHIPVLHVLGFVWLSTRYDRWMAWYGGQAQWPADYQARLLEIYLGWSVVTLGLYFVCRWFAEVKRRRSDWWLRYL